MNDSRVKPSRCVVRTRWAYVLTLALNIALYSLTAYCLPSPTVGTVGALQGASQAYSEVSQQLGTVSKREPPRTLSVDDPIYVTDTITTQKDSKLWIKLDDGGDVSLGAGVEFKFNHFVRSGSVSRFHGHLGRNPARFIVRFGRNNPGDSEDSFQERSKGSFSYVITTPTAHVEVVPEGDLADFVVEALAPGQTSVKVIWGKVRVRNIRAALGGDQNPKRLHEVREVRSCQMVYVKADEEPSPVLGIGEKGLRRAMEKTTIPGTLPQRLPDCRGPEDRCPCPPGEAMDQDEGRCKPCAWGAYYDYETCSCQCPCPDGQVQHPFNGQCMPECPTQFPRKIRGFGGPDVLPQEGCPSCACCEITDPFCVSELPGGRLL